MLRRAGFRVGADHLHWFLLITVFSVGNSLLGLLQRALWGARARRVRLGGDPIFILGHWRTGTTWLHELLCLDDRHTAPTTYECFFPGHFLLTAPLYKRIFAFGVPTDRPMDAMAMGWERPQEDEFAMCNSGQPSPYLSFAFPNRRLMDPAYLTLDDLPPGELALWKETLIRFLKHVTIRRPKTLVLKSPIHTYRVKHLLDMFPRARFVHIVRHPVDVFASTMNLWISLCHTCGLHRPDFRGLEDLVFDNFVRLHEKLEEARPLLDPARFHEVRYEDLVADPVREVRAIYDHLDLGDFDAVRPRLDAVRREAAAYRPNRYRLDEDRVRAVSERWGDVMRRYGYLTAEAGAGRGSSSGPPPSRKSERNGRVNCPR